MASPPYDTLEAVANTARVRLNDAIQSIGGDIFQDTAQFALTAVNTAWRRLQEMLADYGLAALNREIIFSAVPAAGVADQSSQVSINWAGYFNGTTLANPIFPGDLITPLGLEERVNGNAANFWPMDRVYNGLPTAPKTTLNKLWEWRQETIYMPGATGLTDIRLRYAGYLIDFVAAGTAAWSTQPVPIMRSLNPFSWLIASEIARARGDLDAGAFDQNAQVSAEQIFNREYLRPRSLFKGSELGKMTDPNTPTKGATGPRGKVA